MPTFFPLIPLPENRHAVAAAELVVADVGAPRPLFLHGPPGTGKTHLVQAIADQANGRIVAASDLPSEPCDCPLFVVEDVQHLPARSVEALVQLLDNRAAQEQQTVLTATLGPGRLPYPLRLTSRLAAGLVVELQPFSAASRLTVLQHLARRRSLNLPAEVLAWLAEHLIGGGRQLDGALTRIATLARMRPGPWMSHR